MDSCNLLIELIRILLKRKYIQEKILRHFCGYVANTKLFCLKSLVPVARAKLGRVVHMGKFFSWLHRSVTGPARRASHINPSKILRRKQWQGEILETEPSRLTGLIRRGSKLSWIFRYLSYVWGSLSSEWL